MTDDQINYCIQNSKNLSARQLAKIVGVSSPTILNNMKKFGITFKSHKNNSNIEQFKNISNPRIAYFFGLLWADGYFITKKNNKVTGIGISLLEPDMIEVEKIIEGLFVYSAYLLRRKNRKPGKTIVLCDTLLAEFFKKINFKNKSFTFPDLNFIDKDCHQYFWRGYFDGDGHIDISGRLQVSGNIRFDWTEFLLLCKTLDTKDFIIRKYINSRNNNQFSSIRLDSESSNKFFNYIYKDNLDILLSRKYNKFIGITNDKLNKEISFGIRISLRKERKNDQYKLRIQNKTIGFFSSREEALIAGINYKNSNLQK